jgi:hypothetical protein
MRFWKSKKEFAALVPKPTGGSVSVYRGQFVEGDYFAKFSFLEEVPESEVDKEKVLFSQTGLTNQSKAVFLDSGTSVDNKPAAPEPTPEATPAPVDPPEDEAKAADKKAKNGVKKNG